MPSITLTLTCDCSHNFPVHHLAWAETSCPRCKTTIANEWGHPLDYVEPLRVTLSTGTVVVVSEYSDDTLRVDSATRGSAEVALTTRELDEINVWIEALT